MYDLIIQNNASREFFLYQGLENRSVTELYIEFNPIDLDVPDGEYTYACLKNDNSGTTYTFKTPILDTIVHQDEEDIILREKRPYTGLMRVGTPKSDAVYDDENNTTYFYEG